MWVTDPQLTNYDEEKSHCWLALEQWESKPSRSQEGKKKDELCGFLSQNWGMLMTTPLMSKLALVLHLQQRRRPGVT